MHETSFYLSQPLRKTLSYDPSFKVDIRLDEPLWKVIFTPTDIAVEIMTLCSQLEPLCKRSYTTRSGKISNSSKMEYHKSFEPKARLVLRKMDEYLEFLPPPQPTIVDYLGQSGLADLFPKVMSYLLNPERPDFYGQECSLEGHFETFGKLNQLVTLSHQLKYDAFKRTNHKYMAHQLALLYQSVNQVGSQELKTCKKDIESNFRQFKSQLAVQNKESVPRLPDDEKEWINQVTTDILGITSSFPTELTQPVQSSLVFLQKLE